MRETARIEVQTGIVFFCPINPAGEVFQFQFIAADFFAVGFGIDGVYIEPFGTGNKFPHLIDICAQFIGIACFAGMIARYLNTAVKGTVIFKTVDVISLSAVDADRNIIQSFKSFFHIDTESGIDLFCKIKSVHSRPPF